MYAVDTRHNRRRIYPALNHSGLDQFPPETRTRTKQGSCACASMQRSVALKLNWWSRMTRKVLQSALRAVFRSAVLAVAFVPACGGTTSNPGTASDSATRSTPGQVPDTRLIADVSRGEWRMPAGDYGNLRYSTLDTINPSNVKELR